MRVSNGGFHFSCFAGSVQIGPTAARANQCVHPSKGTASRVFRAETLWPEERGEKQAAPNARALKWEEERGGGVKEKN